MKLGSSIRALRQGLGLTQRALAQRIGVTPQYVNDIERDRRLPTDRAVLSRIAAALDVAPEYLLYRAGLLSSRGEGDYSPETVRRAYQAFEQTLGDENAPEISKPTVKTTVNAHKPPKETLSTPRQDKENRP